MRFDLISRRMSSIASILVQASGACGPENPLNKLSTHLHHQDLNSTQTSITTPTPPLQPLQLQPPQQQQQHHHQHQQQHFFQPPQPLNFNLTSLQHSLPSHNRQSNLKPSSDWSNAFLQSFQSRQSLSLSLLHKTTSSSLTLHQSTAPGLQAISSWSNEFSTSSHFDPRSTVSSSSSSASLHTHLHAITPHPSGAQIHRHQAFTPHPTSLSILSPHPPLPHSHLTIQKHQGQLSLTLKSIS